MAFTEGSWQAQTPLDSCLGPRGTAQGSKHTQQQPGRAESTLSNRQVIKCRGQRRGGGWHCEWQHFYWQRRTMRSLRMGPTETSLGSRGESRELCTQGRRAPSMSTGWPELGNSPAAKGTSGWGRRQLKQESTSHCREDWRKGMLSTHVRTISSTGSWGTKEGPALGYQGGQRPQGHHPQGERFREMGLFPLAKRRLQTI